MSGGVGGRIDEELKHTPKKKETVQSHRLAEYNQRFRRASQGMNVMHEKWKVLDTFDRGEQWNDAAVPLPPWVPKPVTNYIRYTRTLKRANLSSVIPAVHMTAKSETYDKWIKSLHKAYRHVWHSEKVARLVRRCIDRALLQGTSIAVVYNDDTYVGGEYYGTNDPKNALYNGKICVKRFPNANFFPDPDCFSIEEAKFIETTEILPLAFIKANPKFKEYAGKQLEELQSSQLSQDKSADGNVYVRDNDPANGVAGQIHGDEMAELHTHWERFVNPETKKWQLDVTYYLPHCDFELYRIENVKPSCYPFAALYDEEEENSFWGTSMAMDILENQKIINKTDQTASIIATLHQNPQKVVSRESGINAQELARTGTMPGKVWTANGDPNTAIGEVKAPEIPRGMFEVNNQMKADIREMAGINDAYTGESVGSLTTSTGVNSLIERATVRDKDKMVQIDEFVEDLSSIIVQFIIHKWKEKRPVTTNAKNGAPEYSDFEPIPDGVKDNLDWIMKSDTYATAPMTQALKKQQADNLMQMQGQFQFDPPIITPEEWVARQDFEDKDEIMQRMELDREKKKQKEQADIVGIATQAAEMGRSLQRQGQSAQEIQQHLQQFIQQAYAQIEQAAAARNSAARQSNGPQGTTGQLAMSAMSQGA